jgi:tetratricopeptide (TPR) repeat protein
MGTISFLCTFFNPESATGSVSPGPALRDAVVLFCQSSICNPQDFKKSKQGAIMQMVIEHKNRTLLSAITRLLIPLCIIPVLIGCAAYRFPVIRPVTEVGTDAINRYRAEEYFIKALDYDRRGLPQMSEHFYEMAYEFDPSSKVLRNLLAGQYIESGKYTQALLLIRGSSKLETLAEDEQRMLATIYLKTGQFDKAAQVLDQIKNKTPEEIYSLGLIFESTGKTEKSLGYYRQYFAARYGKIEPALKIGMLLLKLKQYDRAESLCVALEQDFGQPPSLLNYCGAVSMAREDTAEALNFFKMALIADSTYEDAMRNMAQIYIQRNEYHEAIEYYRRLFDLPSWGEVYGRTLAMLYYYDNQPAEAERIIKRLLSDDVDDYELHYYLGLVFNARDNSSLARIELEKSIALQPAFEECWRQICYLGIKEKNLDQALNDAQRFTKNMPEKSSSWRMLGVVYTTRKEYDKSQAALRKAINIDSTDVAAWFELGSNLERQKKLDSAAVIFKKVLSLRKDDPVAANYLGYMWADKGIKLDTAMTLIEGALRKDPGNGAYLDSKAWVFYKLDKNDSAYVYITRAMEKIDDDPVVYEHLGDILVQKGDLPGAAAAYEKCLGFNPENLKDIEQRLDLVRGKLPKKEPGNEKDKPANGKLRKTK